MCLKEVGFRRYSRAEWDIASAHDDNLPANLKSGRVPARDRANENSDIETACAPLCRMLADIRNAKAELRRDKATYLGGGTSSPPFIVGVAGSVAVGKSTFAQTLRMALKHNNPRLSIEIVTTDGFLYPNAILEEHGLLKRKGFPESYNVEQLNGFLRAARGGGENLTVPIYSHMAYDITGGSRFILTPNILILDGLNVLQGAGHAQVASDLLDFSIYVDAEEEDIQRWYTKRFLALQAAAKADPAAYFYRFRDLSIAEASEFAARVWTEINLPNLRDHIFPTRVRADLILRKGPQHALDSVWLKT